MVLPKVSVVFLQAIVFVHFVLTVWANQCPWLPVSYQFCNFLVLMVGVGAIVASSNSQLAELFFIGMVFSILHDIIVLAKYHTDSKVQIYEIACGKSHFNFCFAMSIINILLKPLSCILIFLNYIDREGPGLKDGFPRNKQESDNAPLPKPEDTEIPPY